MFSNLFKKAEPDRKDSDEPRSPRAVFYRGSRPVVVYDNFCRGEAALKHPVIQRCLRMITRAVQVVDWYAELDPDAPGGRKTDVRYLNDALRSPNNNLTAANMRYWMALSMAVYGRIPIKVSVSASHGNPNGFYPLDAAHLRTTTDSAGRINGYEYGPQSDLQRFKTRRQVEGSRDSFAYVIASPGLSADPSKTTDLINPLDSLGKIAKTIDALMLRSLATAQGHPNAKYIVTSESELTEDQQDELEEAMEDAENGGDRSGEIIFLRGAKVTVTKLDADLSDIHSKMPMDDLTRAIFGAFGIPIALAGIGAADAARYASNFSESRASFYQDTIIPEYLSPIADGLTQALAPAGVRIRFDIDTIPALLQNRLATAATLKDIDFLTTDEKRELLGFAPRGTQDE